MEDLLADGPGKIAIKLELETSKISELNSELQSANTKIDGFRALGQKAKNPRRYLSQITDLKTKIDLITVNIAALHESLSKKISDALDKSFFESDTSLDLQSLLGAANTYGVTITWFKLAEKLTKEMCDHASSGKLDLVSENLDKILDWISDKDAIEEILRTKYLGGGTILHYVASRCTEEDHDLVSNLLEYIDVNLKNEVNITALEILVKRPEAHNMTLGLMLTKASPTTLNSAALASHNKNKKTVGQYNEAVKNSVRSPIRSGSRSSINVAPTQRESDEKALRALKAITNGLGGFGKGPVAVMPIDHESRSVGTTFAMSDGKQALKDSLLKNGVGIDPPSVTQPSMAEEESRPSNPLHSFPTLEELARKAHEKNQNTQQGEAQAGDWTFGKKEKDKLQKTFKRARKRVLLNLIKGDNEEDFQKEIEEGNLNASEAIGGHSLTYVAAQYGSVNILTSLEAEGTNLDDVNNSKDGKHTPLCVAAACGKVEACEFLIYKKARIDGAKKGGSSPIYAAVKNGHMDVVRLLLENGVDVNVTNRDGGSLLRAALESNPSKVNPEENYMGTIVYLILHAKNSINVNLLDFVFAAGLKLANQVTLPDEDTEELRQSGKLRLKLTLQDVFENFKDQRDEFFAAMIEVNPIIAGKIREFKRELKVFEANGKASATEHDDWMQDEKLNAGAGCDPTLTHPAAVNDGDRFSVQEDVLLARDAAPAPVTSNPGGERTSLDSGRGDSTSPSL